MAGSQAVDRPVIGLTAGELRRDRTLAPGSAGFAGLVRAFLPLIYGTVSSVLPEEAGASSRVAVAVFRCFALRWRRLPRKTLIASWLFQSASFSSRRERQRLGLAAPAPGSDAAAYAELFRELSRWSSARLDPLVLHGLLHETLPAASSLLRLKQGRVAAQVKRGQERLAKVLRKRGIQLEPLAVLGAVVVPVTAEVEEAVVAQSRTWQTQIGKDPDVQSLIRTWQWIGAKRILRRVVATVGVAVFLIAALVGSLAWMARQGHLTLPVLRFFNHRLAKEIPEIVQPARPWPSAAQTVVSQTRPPATAAELYSPTNIWIAKLTFTPEQWERLEPSPVPLSSMSQNGQMTLRNPNARRSGLAGVMGLEYNWVEAQLQFAGTNFPKVAVRYRGNGTFINSLFGPKQPFKVALEKFTKDQCLAGTDTLNFVNAIPDNSYLHDALAERLFRDLGAPAPRTSYAYLTVEVRGKGPGQPLGLYVLVEAVDKAFVQERFGSPKVPVFKPVTTELFKDLGPEWKTYAPIYDLKTRATPAERQRVIDFARLVSHATDQEFARELDHFLDLEEFAAFLAGHVLLASYDGFLANGQNFYLYLDPRSLRFGFIPWDQDHAWGEFGYVATADERERASIWQPSTYPNRFLERVLKVEAFRSLYRRQLERCLSDLFTAPRLYAQIDELAAIIRPAVAAESDFRLKRFDLAVSTNWLSGPRDGAPEGPKAPVHQMKRFIVNRIRSVHAQLEGREKGVVLTGFRPRQPE